MLLCMRGMGADTISITAQTATAWVSSPSTHVMMPAVALQGIFLHGTVGSGKTMLMDHFLSAIGRAGTVPRVRRMHFNEAMDELHRRMHRLELERERLDAKQNEAFLQSVAAHEHNAVVCT